MRAETVEQGHGQRLAHRDEYDADPEGDPERLGREPCRTLVLSGSRGPRDDRRRPVGEEVEDRERPGEHRAREPERRDLRPAQMADDRRVHEHVERLRRERPEGGESQAEDLAVVRGAEAHRARTIMAR